MKSQAVLKRTGWKVMPKGLQCGFAAAAGLLMSVVVLAGLPTPWTAQGLTKGNESRAKAVHVVAVPAVAMTLREGSCQGQCSGGQGQNPATGDQGILTGVNGLVYAPLYIPSGSKITRLEMIGFDENGSNGQYMEVQLLAVRDRAATGVQLATLRLPGGGSKRYRRASVRLARTVVEGQAYYVQASMGTGGGALPMGLSMIRVTYTDP